LGITCVGKSTVGRLLGERLGYRFFNLDLEIKDFFSNTLANIYYDCNRLEIDKTKALVLEDVLLRCEKDSVIAISPIYYWETYERLLDEYEVFCIELRDKAKHIAKRLVFTDENDVAVPNDKRKRCYFRNLRSIKRIMDDYSYAHRYIETKVDIDGRSALEAAIEIEDIIQSKSTD